MQKVHRFFSCIALLAFTIVLASCGQQQTIVNGVDEREANEIVVLMASHGIQASKIAQPASNTGGGGELLWNIDVPGPDTTRAMSILNRNGLPRREGENLLGLFSKQGLVPSDREEAIRYQAGLASQLANTIRKWEGIVDADVSISFPDADESERGVPITASVYIKHQGILDDPNSQIVPKIKRYIAGAVVGLDYNNITVVGDRVRASDYATSAAAQPATLRHVWGIAVADASVTRFQVTFLLLCLVLLAFGAAITWIVWKVYPLLDKVGGIGALFSMAPLKMPENKPSEAPDGKAAAKPEAIDLSEEGVDLGGLGHHGFDEQE